MTAHDKRRIINEIMSKLNKFYEPELTIDVQKGIGARIGVKGKYISPRLNINDLYYYLNGFNDALECIEQKNLREKEIINGKKQTS